jgi:hypothetical protein
MMSPANMPVEVLEERAEEQRRKLHNSVSELKSSVRETVREQLDIRGHLRKYFWPAAATVSAIGLIMGYSIAGIFSHR